MSRHRTLFASITAGVGGLALFLGAYGDLRSFPLLVCDGAWLVGQRDSLDFCRDERLTAEQLALYSHFNASKDTLTPEQQELFDRLKTKIQARALAQLERMGADASEESDPEAAAAKRDAVASLGQRDDAASKRALELIADGDLAAGFDLLEQSARETSDQAAARWRELGQLAFGHDTARALTAYRKAVALDGTTTSDRIYLGRLYERAGDLRAAEESYATALSKLAEDADRDRGVLYSELADIRTATGDLDGGLDSYRETLAIHQRLAERDPSNTERQRDLLVSYNKIGDVLTATGDLDAARDIYRDALAIAQRLAERDPGNIQWQRDLSISYEKIGDVLTATGDLDAALDSYRDALAIRKRLSARDPRNTQWQRDLSISHNTIGDVLRATGDLDAALDSYREDLAIAERLAERDPGNSQWQRDLSISHDRIGDVLTATGDLDAALDSYRDALAIRERLAARDPGNTQWQRDLSISHERIGDILRAKGDLDAALDSYRDDLAIGERLAARDPRNAEWQRDVAVSLWKLAQIRDSGISWRMVADKLETLWEAGLLPPTDEKFVNLAVKRANGE